MNKLFNNDDLGFKHKNQIIKSNIELQLGLTQSMTKDAFEKAVQELDLEVYPEQFLENFMTDLAKGAQLGKVTQDDILKAKKDISKLVKLMVTDKNGDRRTVYVKRKEYDSHTKDDRAEIEATIKRQKSLLANPKSPASARKRAEEILKVEEAKLAKMGVGKKDDFNDRVKDLMTAQKSKKAESPSTDVKSYASDELAHIAKYGRDKRRKEVSKQAAKDEIVRRESLYKKEEGKLTVEDHGKLSDLVKRIYKTDNDKTYQKIGGERLMSIYGNTMNLRNHDGRWSTLRSQFLLGLEDIGFANDTETSRTAGGVVEIRLKKIGVGKNPMDRISSEISNAKKEPIASGVDSKRRKNHLISENSIAKYDQLGKLGSLDDPLKRLSTERLREMIKVGADSRGVQFSKKQMNQISSELKQRKKDLEQRNEEKVVIPPNEKQEDSSSKKEKKLDIQKDYNNTALSRFIGSKEVRWRRDNLKIDGKGEEPLWNKHKGSEIKVGDAINGTLTTEAGVISKIEPTENPNELRLTIKSYRPWTSSFPTWSYVVRKNDEYDILKRKDLIEMTKKDGVHDKMLND